MCCRNITKRSVLFIGAPCIALPIRNETMDRNTLGKVTGEIGAFLSIMGFMPTLLQSFREPDKLINIWTLAIFLISDIVWTINGLAYGDKMLFWSMMIQGLIVAVVLVRAIAHKTKKVV